jgi:ABC-type bacteriocin/lantibiotic exporter with double-glycine peptidase domain
MVASYGRLSLSMYFPLQSMTMTNAAKSEYTMGDIVNLMSVDCQRIQDSLTYQFHLIPFFVISALSLCLIWRQMGVATLGCVAVILIISLVNMYLGKLQEKYQGTILTLKSSRIKLLNEVLNGIKVHVIKEKVLIMKYNYCVVRSGSTR